ncbi:MAG: dTDP-glucose 4,6-dehydratase [Pseudanabaena sp. M57BS1SP1A06MG]|nr:dTDP-glucose 4,6-dehydratase [Pseudanabaena sp. M53BS1SP1A06MG]MCA6584580.1 dTDP-glucose 4,6-dehydratase [Pseudanabaena sp. M34BS1SP1A06MG]MCA6592065.1 dTDP-glucose 4,6-dehydratase [Pseudanabaena sp. M38BS1SP1A06MG]MCA6602136.1 dTDP-glucose 4,6-dehydratase [Pseudanabaena sp. M57BS1SP1A06MG]
MLQKTFRKVLVTGGAGFIGSNFVRYALDHHSDWEIVVLDKLTYAGNLDNLKDICDRLTFIQGDIANPDDVEKSVKGVDCILNFAAESHVDRSLRDPRPFIQTNIEGTLLLLEAARKYQVSRFLHVSTDEVYGDLAGSDQHSLESDVLTPRSPYAASKAGAEHLVFAYGISYGLDVVITRGSNTYGLYQYPEKIIPLFITNALETKSLPIYGDGSAVRDYLYVEDHCSGIDTVLHRGKGGQAYNLGARLEISGVTVAQTILDLLDLPTSLMQYVRDRPGHDYRYSVDPSAAEALGWQRQWDFQRGMAQTVAWYKQHPEWWQAVKAKKVFQEHYSQWYANPK